MVNPPSFSTAPGVPDAGTVRIQARELVKDYGPVRAVNGLSFSVHAGEIVGLLGPNGSGKTTTQRMLAGLMAPTLGSVEIGGIPMGDGSLDAKRLIGYQSGDTQLYERLTPREVLRFFADIHGMPAARREERIGALFAEFEIGRFADRRLASLSSGQKQRVALARTIVHDPPVLILDEVTASLDILSSRFVMEYLAAARTQGKAILFSTHILSEAEHLCSRILLLHEGSLLAEGAPEELIARTGARNLTECFFAFLEGVERG